MDNNQPVCWKCGASIEELPLPLARLAECPACHTDLHICKMCRFYATGIAKSCREPIAEEVKEKERSNFCDYFQLLTDAHKPQDSAESDASKAQLNALFGLDSEPSDNRSAADAAKEQLEQLFKK